METAPGAHSKQMTMNLPFPLFSLPGAVISLDDEEIFHRLLTRFLPSSWKVVCFTDQSSFAVELEHQLQLQEKVCTDLASVLAQWRSQGGSIIPGLLRFWGQLDERPASLVMIDFRMPYATGVEVLSRPPLQTWDGGKLLVTAHADDRVAVDAFNKKLISQFISKGSLSGDRAQTVALISALRQKGNALIEQTWSSQISLEQLEVLESIKEPLWSILQSQGVEDFAVIGNPFGVLCRRAEKPYWIQLASEQDLASQADAQRDAGATELECEEIRRGRKLMLPDLGLVQSAATAKEAVQLGDGSQKVWGAMFEIESAP